MPRNFFKGQREAFEQGKRKVTLFFNPFIFHVIIHLFTGGGNPWIRTIYRPKRKRIINENATRSLGSNLEFRRKGKIVGKERNLKRARRGTKKAREAPES
jgi:hypothetical protein